MPKGKVAAGFVIFRRISEQIQYLMMQTSYGVHHWTPPKGHVDEGETNEMDTAYRETFEESGLTKSDLKIFTDSKQVARYNVNGKPKTVFYWLAELITSAEVRMSDEHQDYKWLELEEACKIAVYKEMQDILIYYDNYLKNLKYN